LCVEWSEDPTAGWLGISHLRGIQNIGGIMTGREITKYSK
jgi:hypothetical protein